MVTDHAYEKEEIRDRNGNNVSFGQHVAEWIGFDLGLGLGIDFFFKDKSEEKGFTLIKELTPGSNIFDVIKTGSLDAVRYLVEHYGQRVLYERDGDGHTTVHWVCRLGFSDILAFMLDLGMPLDTPSLSDPEPRPVHWACLSGDVAVMEILIQSGVSVNATDTRGRTPLIVATQKGNTHLVGYLLAKGSDHKLRDNNGDSALHWAAYKGYPDITQLLVHSGSDTEVKDNYGHTPLHLACIGGSVNTVKELTNKCHGNLTVEDEKGRTPLELAINHRNWDVVSYLRTCHKRSFILNAWHFVFGSSTNSRVPLVIFLLVPLCYGYPLYILRCIPLTWRELHSIHVVFLIFNVIVWVSMLIAHSLDPGYLPQNTVEYEKAVEQMADFGKWRESKSPMTRLCHTCRCVRPLRAKHCRVCNRCIQHFDHHCPFIYNCVGLRNRGWFLVFVSSVVIACAMVIYLALATVHADSWRLEYQLGVAIAVLAAAIAGIMTVSVLINALLNLTSNECLNFRRYGYLRDVNGKFNNPFNRGIVRNLEEFFRSVRVWDINDIEPQQGLLV